MIDNRSFLILGLLITLVIGICAVFLASGDPDGLESTALVVQDEKNLIGLSPDEESGANPEAIGTGDFSYEAPFPDYSLGGEAGKTGEIIAIIVGIIITLCAVAGAGYLIRYAK